MQLEITCVNNMFVYLRITSVNWYSARLTSNAHYSAKQYIFDLHLVDDLVLSDILKRSRKELVFLIKIPFYLFIIVF